MMLHTQRLTLVTDAAPAHAALFSPNVRALRFVLTGGLSGLTQLVLLKLFTDQGWQALSANAVAFVLAAQFNFVLSSLFTWRDRLSGVPLRRRWLLFHGSIACMAVLNMLVFAIARGALPEIAASAAGICAAAFGNFFIGDRLVFRPHILTAGVVRHTSEASAA